MLLLLILLVYIVHLLEHQLLFFDSMFEVLNHILTCLSKSVTIYHLYSNAEIKNRFFFRSGTNKTPFMCREFPNSRWNMVAPAPFTTYLVFSPTSTFNVESPFLKYVRVSQKPVMCLEAPLFSNHISSQVVIILKREDINIFFSITSRLRITSF